MIVEIHSENPQNRLIKKVVSILKNGGMVIYPTDTFYGICCDISQKKIINKLYKFKSGEENKRLSIICPNLKDIAQYAYISSSSYRIMKRVLPGPYTFILEATKLTPSLLLSKQKTVGIRVPNNNICRSILEELGNPLASTTAPPPNNNDAPTPKDFHDYYKKQLDLVIDGGVVPSEPSTIVSLIGDTPEIIRQGQGTIEIL